MSTTYYQISTGMTVEQATRILPAGIASHILGQQAEEGVDELELPIHGQVPEEEMQVICVALCALLEGWVTPLCVVTPDGFTFHAFKHMAAHRRFVRKLDKAAKSKRAAPRKA